MRRKTERRRTKTCDSITLACEAVKDGVRHFMAKLFSLGQVCEITRGRCQKMLSFLLFISRLESFGH